MPVASDDFALICRYADNFFKTANLLQQISDRDWRLKSIVIAPVGTYNAFSLELFFKCLAAIHTGVVPRSHNLKVLFDKIAPATQIRIRAVHAGYVEGYDVGVELARITGGPHPQDFDAVLDASKHAFERFRYLYEKQEASFVAGPILMSTRIVLHEMHPEWFQDWPGF